MFFKQLIKVFNLTVSKLSKQCNFSFLNSTNRYNALLVPIDIFFNVIIIIIIVTVKVFDKIKKNKNKLKMDNFSVQVSLTHTMRVRERYCVGSNKWKSAVSGEGGWVKNHLAAIKELYFRFFNLNFVFNTSRVNTLVTDRCALIMGCR